MGRGAYFCSPWLGLSLVLLSEVAAQQTCYPGTWHSQYVRVSDQSSGEGWATHNYEKQVHGSYESSLGVKDGSDTYAVPYTVRFYQEGSQSWAALNMSDGSHKCYRGVDLFGKNIQCFHTQRATSINDQPAELAEQSTPISGTQGYHVTATAVAGADGSPLWALDFDLYEQFWNPGGWTYLNASRGMNESLLGEPAGCQDESAPAETGEEADNVLLHLGRRMLGMHGRRPVDTSDLPDFLRPMASEPPAEAAAPSKLCTPEVWSATYYVSQDGGGFHQGGITVDSATKSFAQSYFDSDTSSTIVEVVLNTTTYKIVRPQNGSPSCTNGTIPFFPIKQCFDGYTRQGNVVLNNQAAQRWILKRTGSSNEVHYSEKITQMNGIPLVLMNVTTPWSGGYYGPKGPTLNPVTMAYTNGSTWKNTELLTIPHFCP